MSRLGNYLRPRVRAAARSLGYEVHRIGSSDAVPEPEVEPASRFEDDHGFEMMLADLAPSVVIDVGANIGQYGGEVRQHGYTGQIVSFEPLIDQHALLCEVAEADGNWLVGPRTAVGSEEGVAQLHVAGISECSSFLDQTGILQSEVPGVAYVDLQETRVSTLDRLLSELDVDPTGGLLKSDTQGFEEQVLAGASETLAKCAAVQLEMALNPVYEAAALPSKLVGALAEFGFELSYLFPGFRAQSGRLFEFDGVFTRRS